MSACLKKAGTNPELNQQLKTLESMEKQLKELKEKESGYHVLEQDIKEIEKSIDQLHDDIDEVKQQLFFYQTYQQLYHIIENYQVANRYLLEHSKPHVKREINKADVIAWHEKKRDLLQQVSYQQQLIERKKEKIKDSQTRLGEASFYQFLSTINDHESYWREQHHIFLQTKTELDRVMTAIQDEKRNIGLQLDDEMVQQLALPKENVAELDTMTTLYKELDDDLTSKQAELELLLSEGDSLSYERHQLEEALLNDYERQDIEDAIESLKRKHDRAITPKQLLPVFSLASGVLIMTFIALYVMNSFQPFIIIGLMMVYMISLVSLIYVKQRPKVSAREVPTQQEENQLQHYYQVLTRDETAKRKRDELTRDWLIFTRDVEVKEKEIKKQKERKTHVSRNIDRFKGRYPFLSHVVEPRYSAVLASVYQLKCLLEEKATLITSLTLREEKLKQFKQSIIDQCDITEQTSMEGMLKLVRHQYDEHKHARERHTELTEELRGLEDEAQQIEATLMPVVDALAEAYDAYHVKDFEAFIAQHEKVIHYKEMIQQKSEMKQKLELRFSPRALKSIFSEPLINERLLKEYLDEHEDKKQRLDDAHMSIMKQLATLKAEKQQMESSTSYRDLHYQFQMKREAFNQQANEWLMYKISYEQLLKTKRLFQASMLPGILDKASEVFRAVTNNRYHSIDYDDVSKQLFVTHGQGQLVAMELSQGTLDQLVIAIRLGVAMVLNQSIDLPFIIDDSFVHFDEGRKKRLLDYLSQEQRQSFYFTTAPKERLTDYQVIDLEVE
ncbi:ATP-binding protein [Halolactibacillus sp. JCM 19043]|uniref:ATP-binding protein n=1 Tax=Halolactibacillus sp. JCM 19043 TaxID=1460638 RepID=UPI000783B1E5|nr:hypothetical protein [Halolactibacillus sp. JCM 19043]